jgi:hypothetical protein
MKDKVTRKYAKPKVERYGTMRDLTKVGCTLGGDGVWICRVPPLPDEPSPTRS